MSDMSLDNAMNRIMASTTPLAVFNSTKPDCVDVVFADTLVSQQMIKSNDPRLVGIYSRESDVKAVRSVLQRNMLNTFLGHDLF